MHSSRISRDDSRRVWGPVWLGVALVLLGASAFWFAGDIGRTGTGGGNDPGPRFFPMLLSLMLVIFGLLQAVIGFFRCSEAGSAAAQAPGALPDAAPRSRRWLIMLAVLVVYVIAMDWIGFSASTFLMAVGLMIWLGNRWWVAVVVAVLMVAVVRLLFVVLFRVQLPAGELGLPF
jgi:putative tricarboxylic transport membrane protein